MSCLLERETLSHIYRCWEIEQIFEYLSAELPERISKARHPVGAHKHGRAAPAACAWTDPTGETVLPGALSDLYIIVWKFIILGMVKVETDQVRHKHLAWVKTRGGQEYTLEGTVGCKHKLSGGPERTKRRMVARVAYRRGGTASRITMPSGGLLAIRARPWSDEIERMRHACLMYLSGEPKPSSRR